MLLDGGKDVCQVEAYAVFGVFLACPEQAKLGAPDFPGEFLCRVRSGLVSL